MKEFIEYAPIIVIVLLFLFKSRIFITPEQMQQERKDLLKEVENRFLSLVAFREFEKRIEDNFKTLDRRFSDSSKRFDKIDESLEHITDFLMNHNH